MSCACHDLIIYGIYFLGSGAVCLAHCDGSSTWSEVLLVVKTVASLSKGCKDGRYDTDMHLKISKVLFFNYRAAQWLELSPPNEKVEGFSFLQVK